MSKNESVKSQEPRAKRQKTKIIKWEYVTKPFDVKVLPDLFTRLHAPLVPWLSSLTENCYVHLRPCVQGVDEDGAVVKYLYCTRDGRFFVRKKDGWGELKPGCYGNNPKKKGGSTDCPQLRWFGSKPTHRCVAFAWCNPPQNAAELEVDHLNTDHKNWTADNLEWVTAEENRRRGAIAQLMRLIGLDPKLLTPTLARGINTLPTFFVIYCLNRFKHHCSYDWSQLSVEAIRLNFAKALDDVKNWVQTGETTTRQQYQWLLKKIREHKNKTTKKQQQS